MSTQFIPYSEPEGSAIDGQSPNMLRKGDSPGFSTSWGTHINACKGPTC